jgi:hypothetical protein
VPQIMRLRPCRFGLEQGVIVSWPENHPEANQYSDHR